MNTTFSNGYAVGTITIPDPNPGITGIKQVPAGAQSDREPSLAQVVDGGQ